MFKAFIIACHIANPADCILISDDRGPYDTEEECKTRIVEMIEESIDVFRMMQVPMIFNLTSCVHPDDIEFTNVNITDQYSKR
tara:strand:+ start:1188 stop:1436 length:249 start_codon:yes stop_codon:yes gene_type:complete